MPAREPKRERTETGARAAILAAALAEFAELGYAGARTEAIARAAGCNVALVFYYFRTKDQLYAAVLEKIFADWSAQVSGALEKKNLTAAEQLAAYVAAYFDFVSSAPARPRLVQQEMMRRGGHSPLHLRKWARRYIKPVHLRVRALVREGIRAGEFRRVDPEHTAYSITGIINFYFASSPVVRLLAGRNPLSLAGIRGRRAEVLKFIRNAVLASPRAPAAPRSGTRKSGRRERS